MTQENLFRFDSNNKQKKYVKASIVFVVALFIGFVIYSVTTWLLNIDKTATIEVLVAPNDAVVKIDGKTYPTESKIKIKPGTYAVQIEKDGFISYNGSIKAIADETSYLYEFLNETDENGNYYNDHESDNARTQQISDKKADVFHEKYNGTDQIWNVTPYDDYNSGYKIYAEKNETGNIIVNIYLYTCSDSRIETLKQKAHEYLEEKKIDLKKYEVKYSSCS